MNGDSNLISNNIKKNISIFGIVGNLESSPYKVYQTAFNINSATSNLTIPFEGVKSEEKIIFLYAGVVNGLINMPTLPTLEGAYITNKPNVWSASGPSIFLKTFNGSNWLWESPGMGTLSPVLQNNQCIFTTNYNNGQWSIADEYGYWAILVTDIS